MLSKDRRYFLIIHIQSSSFRIKIPIPLFIVFEILDDLIDLLSLFNLLIPSIKVKVNHNLYTYHSVYKIFEQIVLFIYVIQYTEKIELVTVETKDEKISIKLV